MPEKRYLVTKANELIMSRYDLTLAEQRLIVEVASMISPDDEEFKDYDVSVEKYLQLIDSNAKNEYQRLKDLAETILKKPLFIKNPNGGFTGLNWFSSIEYKPGEGVLQCHFDEKLKPYLLQLKEKFTSYQLENILRLKSKYAIRIYEILKSKSKLGTFEIELTELRSLVAIPTVYSWQDIKRQILNPSKKALKSTDIQFTYEPIKRSRRIHALRFFITEKKQQLLNLGTPAESERDGQVLTKLLELVPGRSRRSVKKLLEEKLKSGVIPSFIAEKIKYVSSQKVTKNYGGFLRRAIENDYSSDENSAKKEAKKTVKAVVTPVPGYKSSEKIKKIRGKYNNLSVAEKQEYIKKAMEKYPEVDPTESYGRISLRQIAASIFEEEVTQIDTQ